MNGRSWARTFPMLLTALAVAVGTAAGQDASNLRGLELEGAKALDARQFDSARDALLRGVEIARALGEEDQLIRYYFYLGLSYQQEAGGDRLLLREAERYYTAALELRPEWGPALNNLAELRTAVGDTAGARELLARAVRAEGGDKSLYAKNYGELLVKTRQPGEAIAYYEAAVEAEPRDVESQRQLLDLLIEHEPDRVGGHLWDLIDARQVTLATQSAFGALEGRDWGRSAKEELIAVIAAGLGGQVRPQDTFAEGAAERLSALSEDPDIGRAASELIQLYEGEDLEPERYEWWAERGDITFEPQRGEWPRDAFRGLIRAFGDEARRDGATARAESYYRLAAQLTPREPDPDAFLRLIDLYAQVGDTAAMESVAESYVPRLFFGKQQEYSTSHYASIYRYHRALGVIYTYLEQWGDRGTITSTIFQLEHALQAAQIHNDRGAGASPIVVDERLVEMLARAYAATGEVPDLDVVEAALDLSRDALDRDAGDQAVRLLQAVEKWPFDVGSRTFERYQRLRREAGLTPL